MGPRAGLDLFHRWGNAHGAVFQLHGCRAAHGVIDLGTSNARNVAVWSVQQTGENAMINRLTASIGKYVKMWETLWKIYYLVGEIKEIWAITMEIYVPKRVNSYSWEHIWTCCISTHFRGDMCFLLMWHGCQIEHEWHQKHWVYPWKAMAAIGIIPSG